MTVIGTGSNTKEIEGAAPHSDLKTRRKIDGFREPCGPNPHDFSVGFRGAADRLTASFVLRARHADGREETLRVSDERRIIGSHGDILAHGIGVEPQHAELVFRGGVVGVRDLGTESGTWIEGRRMPRRVLRPGRAFRIGGTRFELIDVQTDGPAPEAAGDFDDLQTRLMDVRGGAGGAPVITQLPTRRPPPVIVDADVVRSRPRPTPAPRRSAPQVEAPARVIVAEAEPNNRAWLLASIGECWSATTCSEVLAHLGQQPRLVVVVGYRLLDGPAEALVAALQRPDIAPRVSLIVVQGVAPQCHDPYYRLTPGVTPEVLQRVVASATRPRPAASDDAPSDTRAWHDKQVFEICAAASARPDPIAAAQAVEEGVARMLNAGRVSCVFHDASAGAVWTETGDNPIEGSAATGIIGFVARTAEPVHAPAAGADPRYDASLDNPGGTPSDGIFAVPIAARGEVHAVLVLARSGALGMFERKDCMRLVHLARELGPIFARMSAAVTAEDALAERQRPKAMAIYRPEAVEAYINKGEEGEVIRIAPHWTAAMYWALLAMLIVGGVGIAIGSIANYSSGPAVIRQDGRAEVAAVGAGAVATVEVEPGQRVTEGQILVRLRDVTQRAEYDAIRNDFRTQLRNRLLDPNDAAAASAVVSLRRQLYAAEAILEQRVVRAPHAGVVSDIRVDPGQQVGIGDAVMAVVDDQAPGLEIIAFLPGGDRPLIEAGMPLRLELQGFDYAYQDLEVATITDGIVGPAEARRILGAQLADTLPMDGGGVIMVRATLPTATFVSDGSVYPYHDGMGGTAEVRTREETILEMIVPALKEFSL